MKLKLIEEAIEKIASGEDFAKKVIKKMSPGILKKYDAAERIRYGIPAIRKEKEVFQDEYIKRFINDATSGSRDNAREGLRSLKRARKET